MQIASASAKRKAINSLQTDLEDEFICNKSLMLCFRSFGKAKDPKAMLLQHLKEKHGVKMVQLVDKETRQVMLPWDYWIVVEADNKLYTQGAFGRKPLAFPSWNVPKVPCALFLICRDFQRFLGDVFYCFSLDAYNDCMFTLKVKDHDTKGKAKWYAMSEVEAQVVQPEADGMMVYDRLIVPHLYRSDEESKRKRRLDGPGDKSTNPATALDVVFTLNPLNPKP